MRMIVPCAIGQSQIVSSNILENDYPEFATGVAYTQGDRVIVTAQHKVYEALSDHTSDAGNAPTVEGTTTWFVVGATNLHKPFDGFISDAAVNTASITYEITPGSLCTAVAIFGANGHNVQLVVNDPNDGEVFNQSIGLISTSNVFDEYSYCFAPFVFETEALFADLPPYQAATFTLTVTSDADAQLGQLVIGEDIELGITKTGTSVSFEDYSQKERDTFGRAIIVERPFADIAEFDFAFPAEKTRLIRDLVAAQRAKPTVYYTAADKIGYGTLVYGLTKPLNVVLTSHNISDATLEVESLI
ncbi:hypothetical protein [Cognatishimia sp.]|uniref:hypothetical protein n=1 Tax=Cognatishimia sp. TaxID=2211648 RepID=UPI00351586A2|nr:hypothetical protein [Cognatishimia sp.]